MDSRSIQKVGNRSYSITLPQQWIAHNKHKTQDEVYVCQNTDNELIISAKKATKEKSSTLVLHVTDTRILRVLIMFCYIKNVDRIELHFKDLNYEVSKEARATLQYLEGYEITQEQEKILEISFLFKEVDITIPRIIRRMLYLIKLQVDAIKQKDEQGLLDAEITIDRLYYLSKRLIFASFNDVNLRKMNGAILDEDLLFLRNILKRLENISDVLCKSTSEKVDAKELAAYDSLVAFLELVVTQAVSTSELKERYVILEKEITKQKAYAPLRIVELIKDVLDGVMNIEFSRLLNENKLDKIV